MTSTNPCVLGIGNRNSSRVLRPPGGASSFNIFGTAQDDVKPSKPVVVDAQSTSAESSTLSKNDTAASDPVDTAPATEASTVQSSDNEDKQNDIVASESCETNTDGSVEVQDKENKEVAEVLQDKGETSQDVTVAETPKVEASLPTTSEMKQSTPSDTQNKNKGGSFNPITGAAYNTTTGQNAGSPKPSTRVRQPPGGASTKLW